MQTDTYAATRRAVFATFSGALTGTLVLSRRALAVAPDNTFALIAAHRVASCDRIQATDAKEALVQSLPREMLASPRILLGGYPTLRDKASAPNVWATSLAEIDDHVDRLLDEKSTIWPAGHMASIRERFDTKRKEWKAELAEAQRVNKQRQDETGLTAVQRAEAAASATESESWENLLNSPPTSLAGALAFTRYVLKSLREDTHQERTKEPNEGALRALVTMETSLAGVAGV